MAAPDKEKGKNAGALFPFTLSQIPFPISARRATFGDSALGGKR
jgi:hypothetical protein